MVRHLSYNPNSSKKEAIELPYSKSVVNRLLILNYPNKLHLEELKVNDDIKAMQSALKALHQNRDIYIEEAGTVLRFVLALAAATPGYRAKITLGKHLASRPILPLVEILQQLSAEIEVFKNGFRITGKKLKSIDIVIDKQTSSQFISALMMIAPRIQDGLNITLAKEQSSYSYIKLTAQTMKEAGYQLKLNDSGISIQSVKETAKFLGKTIEKDASASTFFLSLAMIQREKTIAIDALNLQTWQAEKELFDWLKTKQWIQLKQVEGKIFILGRAIKEQTIKMDFSNFPDAALNLIIALAIIGKTIHAEGLQSLNLKESKRLDILVSLLESMNYQVEYTEATIQAKPKGALSLEQTNFHCHNDHRVAMALALLSIIEPIEIQGSACVSKSYPYFWEQIKKVGFNYA